MASVLVVDDSPTVLVLAKRALAKEGHEVESLSCFVELATRLQGAPPDVVVLDLNLPAMSGETLGEFLRRYQERDIQIVIFSGEPPERLEAAAELLGAAAWVEKRGSDHAELIKAVNLAALRRRRTSISGLSRAI